MIIFFSVIFLLHVYKSFFSIEEQCDTAISHMTSEANITECPSINNPQLWIFYKDYLNRNIHGCLLFVTQSTRPCYVTAVNIVKLNMKQRYLNISYDDQRIMYSRIKMALSFQPWTEINTKPFFTERFLMSLIFRKTFPTGKSVHITIITNFSRLTFKLYLKIWTVTKLVR